MIGLVRKSKAKAYTGVPVKAMAAQYSETIATMNLDIGAKDNNIAQLGLLLQKLQNKPATESALEICLANIQDVVNEELTFDNSEYIQHKQHKILIIRHILCPILLLKRINRLVVTVAQYQRNGVTRIKM